MLPVVFYFTTTSGLIDYQVFGTSGGYLDGGWAISGCLKKGKMGCELLGLKRVCAFGGCLILGLESFASQQGQ